MKYIFLLLVLSFGYANLMMPAMFVQGQLASLPVIISSFAIEAIIITLILKTKWRTGIFYSVLSNMVSLIVGIPFRSFIVVINASMNGMALHEAPEIFIYINLLFLSVFIAIINTFIEFGVLATFYWCCGSKKYNKKEIINNVDEKSKEIIKNADEKSKEEMSETESKMVLLLGALSVGNFITAAMAIFL